MICNKIFILMFLLRKCCNISFKGDHSMSMLFESSMMYMITRLRALGKFSYSSDVLVYTILIVDYVTLLHILHLKLF